MQAYGQQTQTNSTGLSESNIQWKPIKQMSYMAKLNSFKADNATDYTYDNSNMQGFNQDGSWSPNSNQYNAAQQMNTCTWSDKKQSFGGCFHQLQTQNQISESMTPISFKKNRNLSNEDNKLQRHVSEFQANGYQTQQAQCKEFSQNQISVQNQPQNGRLININLQKGQNKLANSFFQQNISSASNSTNDNSNCNSDVEIIDDSYEPSLQGMTNLNCLNHSKSMMVPPQTTSGDAIERTPFQLQKLQSSFSTFNESNFDDVSSFGEATRSTQKKRFVNKEERFEFNQKIEKMKKTEMCRNIIMYSHCKYGDSCSYAHNMNELVPKSHLPSNYKTKMCHQFQHEGHCMYGQRCQFLHSIYDLTDKKNLSYKRGLAEEARLTLQRIQQGSDCIMVNILKGKGCVAPDERLPVFVKIYNKEDYKAELHKQEQERSYKGFSNSYGNNFDNRSQQYYGGHQNNHQYYNNNKMHQQQFSYQQRKSDTWSNRNCTNNTWEPKQYFDNGSGFKTNYRRFPTYK